MNRQSYMTRALQARDPRYARILGKLGYDTKGNDPAPEHDPVPPNQDDVATLRKQYHEVVGKKPFNGWDANTLREKIKAHQAA